MRTRRFKVMIEEQNESQTIYLIHRKIRNGSTGSGKYKRFNGTPEEFEKEFNVITK